MDSDQRLREKKMLVKFLPLRLLDSSYTRADGAVMTGTTGQYEFKPGLSSICDLNVSTPSVFRMFENTCFDNRDSVLLYFFALIASIAIIMIL